MHCISAPGRTCTGSSNRSRNALSPALCTGPRPAYDLAMESRNLYAPWRMDYIRSLGSSSPSSTCFICDAAAAVTPEQQRDRLVLWSSEHCVILMNRFPYTNGHLMVAPRLHQADFDELSSEQLLDMQVQTADAVRLLKRAVSAQGFNIGINLGRCAGAGVPGHLHQHIVPRWAGDVNFMHVIGETQIVPQALSQLWEELRRVKAAMADAAQVTR
jgi:ATP adenylyltransferase